MRSYAQDPCIRHPDPAAHSLRAGRCAVDLGADSILTDTRAGRDAAIVGTTLFQQAVSRWLNRLASYIHRISALFLIGAGLYYLVYYWVFIAGLV